MQNPELEHKLNEFRDLIGRDAESVTKFSSGMVHKNRGPITRVTYCSHPGEPGIWLLSVGWTAFKVENEPFLPIGAEPGNWILRLRQDPEEEERGNIFESKSTIDIFKSAELIEQADGTIVNKERVNRYRTGITSILIIHKLGDNLSLDQVSS